MEVEVPPTVVEPTKIKKPVSEAKRKQLESAREKKANQKKVIEPDSESSDEETEPVKKKSKVITKSNSGGNDMEQWGTYGCFGLARRCHVLHAKHLRKKKYTQFSYRATGAANHGAD